VTRPLVANRKPLRQPRPLPLAAIPAPGPLPGLSLLPDSRHALVQRRRGDCERLALCETAWSMAHGVAQAMCPTACPRFVREPRRALETSGGGGIVMAGAS
jgi:hypothetical protein